MTGGMELPYDLSWVWPEPPVTTTEAEKRRWRICVEAVTSCSEAHEASGVADAMFVAAAAHELFFSSIPTD